MKYLYRLHPGQITSRSDGKVHAVSAPELAKLYGVDMSDCVIADPPRAFDRARSYRADPYSSLIQLHPRPDGDYGLFTLFWRDGSRNVVVGVTAAGAMTKAGYGARSVEALDFWAPGDNREYQWSAGEWTLIASLPVLVPAKA